MTQYRTKFLMFSDALVKPNIKTRHVIVEGLGRGTPLLGRIRWFGRWRQYVFEPEAGTVFNPDCMQTIMERTRTMTAEHKAKK